MIDFRNLRRQSNKLVYAFIHDTVMAALTFVLAMVLRLGEQFTPYVEAHGIVASITLFTLSCSATFIFFGLYRGVWAFASVRDMTSILRASSAAVALFVPVAFAITRLEGVPRTVPLIAWFILLITLGGPRLAYRIFREKRLSILWERAGNRRTNVLLVGDNDETDLFIRATANDPQTPYRVVGVISESERRVGRVMHNVTVLGLVENLPDIVEDLRQKDRAPSRVILTRSFARMNHTLTEKLLETTQSIGLSVSRLPSMTELREGANNSLSPQDAPISLEDLLGRPEIILDKQAITSLVRSRRVLVTGAGGSIGSELVRQIASFGPSHITLVDFCEYNLYHIELEIQESYSHLSTRAVMADVRDALRIAQVFRDEKPDLVFHAAAIKHVPIAESNAREAILTNVIGTQHIADCSAKAGVIAMVQISTDKAVNPTNVMGATKKLAESYCQALDLVSTKTRFITVRFGNVLGSMGSVVPRFKEQLAKGGPLTVTHPDITRYFMTIREAVELVLQASSFGVAPGDQRGRVLVLDMGQPVKIADLARQVIRLAGLRPDEDVIIQYTGLRPGEKLYEELFSPYEELQPSAMDGVRIAKSNVVDFGQIQLALNNFAIQLQANMSEQSAIMRLMEMVPEFVRNEE